MRVGSLFSGIGGLELGLERAGMKTVWQAEIDPFCRQVLSRRFPDTTIYEDVRDVDGEAAEVDLICGGFPCQPVSVAGKGLAQDDPRWLWPEFARVVGVLQPTYVLVENVPALATRGLSLVVGTLAALGYDAEWEIVSAASVGAPHLRERLFLVAYPNSVALWYESGWRGWQEREGPILLGRNGETRQVADSAGEGLEGRPRWIVSSAAPRESLTFVAASGSNGGDGSLADSDSIGRNGWPRVFWQARGQESAYSGTAPSDHWTVEPDVGRVAHGVPSRVDRLKSLGNAVVPQVAEYVGRRIIELDRGRRPDPRSAGRDRTRP